MEAFIVRNSIFKRLNSPYFTASSRLTLNLPQYRGTNDPQTYLEFEVAPNNVTFQAFSKPFPFHSQIRITAASEGYLRSLDQKTLASCNPWGRSYARPSLLTGGDLSTGCLIS